MPIIIRLDHVMLDKRMSLVELSRRVGITNVNLSKLKTGKVSAIRLSTLEAICDVLDCQPGDILEFRRDENSDVEEEPFGEDVQSVSPDPVDDRQDARPTGL